MLSTFRGVANIHHDYSLVDLSCLNVQKYMLPEQWIHSSRSPGIDIHTILSSTFILGSAYLTNSMNYISRTRRWLNQLFCITVLTSSLYVFSEYAFESHWYSFKKAEKIGWLKMLKWMFCASWMSNLGPNEQLRFIQFKDNTVYWYFYSACARVIWQWFLFFVFNFVYVCIMLN